jgi:excisionase family DNA binding protein
MPLKPKSSPRQAETSGAGARRRVIEEAPVDLQSPLTSTPAWLSVAQLCRRWQLGRKTIYKFIDSRILPAWKVGSHLYRISVADILRFEAQNALQPGERVDRTPTTRRRIRSSSSTLVSSR